MTIPNCAIGGGHICKVKKRNGSTKRSAIGFKSCQAKTETVCSLAILATVRMGNWAKAE